MKNLYLWLLRHFIRPCRNTSNGDVQVAYLMSFADNDAGLIQELAQTYGDSFLLCHTPNMTEAAANLARKLPAGQLVTALYTPKELLLGDTFRKLKQAQVVVVDNYFPELAELAAPNRKIIQIWHATGAIKEFGWGDPKTANRSRGDQRRFQRVYDSFTHVVVGSEMMAQVFKDCYHLHDEVLCRLGAPRTDHFQPAMSQSLQRVDDQLTTQPAPQPISQTLSKLAGATSDHRSATKGKRILYVPTYRDTIEEMRAVTDAAFKAFAQLAPDVTFVVKLHPHAEAAIPIPDGGNLQPAKGTLTELMARCDALITDYSSCVFDFMLMQPDAPYLFFCPDLAHYQRTTGLQASFQKQMTPRIAETSEALQQLVETLMVAPSPGTGGQDQEEAFSPATIRDSWHRYNDGQAVSRVVKLIKSLTD